jgi:hypothetical protein
VLDMFCVGLLLQGLRLGAAVLPTSPPSEWRLLLRTIKMVCGEPVLEVSVL